MTIGIYAIESPSGNFYVGSSVNIERRFTQHKRGLKKGTLNSPHQGNISLQSAYLKYKLDLKFYILEETELESLRLKEQEYLDLLKPEYNASRYADSPSRTPSIRAKIASAAQERGKSVAFIAQVSERATRLELHRALHSPEAIAKKLETISSPEHRKKLSSLSLRRKSHEHLHSDASRTKVRETMRTPEFRAKRSDLAKTLNSSHRLNTESAKSKAKAARWSSDSSKTKAREALERTMSLGKMTPRKQVLCVEEDKIYESLTAAAKAMAGNTTGICRSAKGVCKAYGYTWRYVP